MDEADVSGWFDEYLDVFAASGRGERDVDSLLAGTVLARRKDGREIAKLAATYLITAGPDGRRISVPALHGA